MRRGALRPIVFDATGTLIELAEPVGEVYHRVALRHGVDLPAWRLDDAFERVMRHPRSRDEREGGHGFTPECERERWFDLIRQTFQATDSTARFEDFSAFAGELFDTYAAEGAWQLRAGVPEMLARLRDEGRLLAIGSNFDHRLPIILEHVGIKRDFEEIAIPSIVGREKPARAFFEWIAERLGAPLEALAYIGDDAPDTLAAIAALGLHTLDVNLASDPASWIERLAEENSATRSNAPRGRTAAPR